MMRGGTGLGARRLSPDHPSSPCSRESRLVFRHLERYDGDVTLPTGATAIRQVLAFNAATSGTFHASTCP
jgi:hypothetical protein